jgi:hypothetical protein
MARQASNERRSIERFRWGDHGMPQHLQQAIASATIEACARELEAWAEITQRADLLHAAAQTLRRNAANIAARALAPAS